MGRIDIRNAFLVEHGLGGADFHFTLLDGCIAAVGLAFIPDGAEPFRVDGQAEQLALVLLEGTGQAQVVEVILCQRVVADMHPELQGHVK